jgi:hypothetical protein
MPSFTQAEPRVGRLSLIHSLCTAVSAELDLVLSSLFFFFFAIALAKMCTLCFSLSQEFPFFDNL